MNIIWLQITSLVYMTILLILYFSKKRIKSDENDIFKKIMIANEVGLLIELSCFVTVVHIDKVPTLNWIVTHALLLYYIIYILLFTQSLFYLSRKTTPTNDFKRKVSLFCVAYFLVNAILVIMLPMYYHTENNIYYSYGPATDLLFVSYGLLIGIWIVCIIKNFKNLKVKKMLPIIALIILGTIVGIVQKIRPDLLLMTGADSIVTFIMYFTIENPDVKMLNELYKNRELMEQGYEDKYNFLFEMTQDAKKPLLDLNRVSNELRQEDDPKKVKEGLMAINNLTRQLDFAINDVLNVSSFDIQKLKIVNTKYDVLKVCDGLNTTMKGEIKKGVTFNMDLPKSVPTLYGDYMKLRQILYSLLNNASKNTDNGSINLRLNVIEKYDFCRLIFNISDTGKGMSIEKINDILSATGELDKNELELLEKKEFNFKVCQKVVKIMGGNIMIKSTVGMGTEITLTMDQRVYHEKETSVLNQYENAINTSKKVLIVAQDKDLANYIKRKLNNNDISYSSLAFGGDAVDRIKAGKSYDYMLVEDDMKEMSGLATLQELKKIKDFEIPVIVMLNESKDSIKDHYIKDGFDDYLLTDNIEEEIKRIIDKY